MIRFFGIAFLLFFGQTVTAAPSANDRLYDQWMQRYYGTLSNAADGENSANERAVFVSNLLNDYFVDDTMVDLEALADPRPEAGGTPRVRAREYVGGLSVAYGSVTPEFSFELLGTQLIPEPYGRYANKTMTYVHGTHRDVRGTDTLYRPITFLLHVRTQDAERITARIVSIFHGTPPVDPFTHDPYSLDSVTVQPTGGGGGATVPIFPVRPAPEPRPTDWYPLGETLTGTVAGEFVGHSVALHGDWLAAGAPGGATTDGTAGRVRVHVWNDTLWQQRGAPLTSQMPGDGFGAAVALAEGRVAVGAPGNGAGSVRVWTWRDDAWEPMGTKLSGTSDGDRFGASVALAGERLAVGAPGRGSGAVHIYRWTGSIWKAMGAPIPGEKHFFGSGTAVVLDGDRIAIGTPEGTSGGGMVRVWEWDGDRWNPLGKSLLAEQSHARFGTTLALRGDRLVVGAPRHERDDWQIGRVQVYAWNGKRWRAQRGGELLGDATHRQFGRSIALDGDLLAVEARGTDGAVRVRVYQWTGSNWKPHGSPLTAPAGGATDGRGIALSRRRLAVGAAFDGARGRDAGWVRVFEFGK